MLFRSNGSVPQNSLCYAKSDNISKKMQLYIQIHKFTIKIDTISINLLFECVKVVEFNFNSHVFLVMYQEILFVNQDVFFFKSRRETTFFDQFCFREGLKTRTQVGIQDGF